MNSPISLETELSQCYEEYKSTFIKEFSQVKLGLIKEYDIKLEEHFIVFGSLMIPLDANYLRQSPQQVNQSLSMLISISEHLSHFANVKLPFKTAFKRPFTYIMSRDQLNELKPRIYPLEFPESPSTKSSGEYMRKLNKRFVIGLAMLNYNVARLAAFLSVEVRDCSRPFEMLSDVLFQNAFKLPPIYQPPFEKVLLVTAAQWNRQTGDNLQIRISSVREL